MTIGRPLWANDVEGYVKCRKVPLDRCRKTDRLWLGAEAYKAFPVGVDSFPFMSGFGDAPVRVVSFLLGGSNSLVTCEIGRAHV